MGCNFLRPKHVAESLRDSALAWYPIQFGQTHGTGCPVTE
jgi:hypothetical protein